MRVQAALIFLSALLPFVASTATPTTATSCESDEDKFWWSEKNCCLPKGGPTETPTPPKGSDCPPSSYYWDSDRSCCLPRQPPPSGNPKPSCKNNWEWFPALQKCMPGGSPSTPPSKPSSVPGHGGHGGHGGYSKRAVKSRSTLCPSGLDACPIKGLSNSSDYECVDTESELESCGGCTSLGKGQDCTAIKGAWNVGCEAGRCAVYSCAGGFQISLDGKACISL